MTSPSKQVRSSNFELLRIICMLMILNLHTFNFGEITQWNFMQFMDFTREATSISAVPIFVLISGYFGIKFKYEKLGSILFNCLFWMVVGYIVCLGLDIADFSVRGLIKRIYTFFLTYWFVTSYIGLMIIAPMLNKWLESDDNKSILKLLLVFYIFALYCQFINYPDFRGGSSILSFGWLYCVGRLLKRSIDENPSRLPSKLSLLGLYVAITFLIAFQAYCSSLYLHYSKAQLNVFIFGFSYNAPLVILQAITVWLIFVQIKIKSKFLNYLGISTLAVYLLHMHPDIKEAYYAYGRELYNYPIEGHAVRLIALFAIVFCVSILIDKMRILLWNLISGKKSK